MKVRAKKTGFYQGHMKRPGTEFTLSKPEHFSDNWMVKAGTPVKSEPVSKEKEPKTLKEIGEKMTEETEDKSGKTKKVGRPKKGG